MHYITKASAFLAMISILQACGGATTAGGGGGGGSTVGTGAGYTAAFADYTSLTANVGALAPTTVAQLPVLGTENFAGYVSADIGAGSLVLGDLSMDVTFGAAPTIAGDASSFVTTTNQPVSGTLIIGNGTFDTSNAAQVGLNADLDGTLGLTGSSFIIDGSMTGLFGGTSATGVQGSLTGTVNGATAISSGAFAASQ